MDKITITSIIVTFAIIGGAFIISKKDGENNTVGAPAENNLTISNGKQIIEIQARGGYKPQRSVAKAGIPTILRFKTRGTFDCSSALRIPSLGINKNLPPSGVTDIEIENPQIGVLRGTCAMGMYSFEVVFSE